ncbi:shikimate kinase [Winogradskyella bathintestinalis]|uniref:Shikimate kinase n=1 Tax=Winogradskyella bathintestinalis TaxID=3035208 RepID=A0ABT7ZX57_9FLAO|nr:shikimate kinase [Winogradskyella bathintestinalis]MDN3493328.1 shikimate kinase [Winogradskyella bathintestinalis]
MIIVLIGYMGSGKSTLGKELATVLNYRFLDLDDYISEKEQASIPIIFKKKGEIYFRKKETEYLTEVITSENLVLALGGGTPCYGNNMNLISEAKLVKSFYLKLSIPLLAKRLFPERQSRPLISHISTEQELLEYIGKHLFERTPYYIEADITVNTDHKSKQEILEALLVHLI